MVVSIYAAHDDNIENRLVGWQIEWFPSIIPRSTSQALLRFLYSRTIMVLTQEQLEQVKAFIYNPMCTITNPLMDIIVWPRRVLHCRTHHWQPSLTDSMCVVFSLSPTSSPKTRPRNSKIVLLNYSKTSAWKDIHWRDSRLALALIKSMLAMTTFWTRVTRSISSLKKVPSMTMANWRFPRSVRSTRLGMVRESGGQHVDDGVLTLMGCT